MGYSCIANFLKTALLGIIFLQLNFWHDIRDYLVRSDLITNSTEKMFERIMKTEKREEVLKNYKYLSVCEKGITRQYNEDSVGIFSTEIGLLIIICDGLGGGLSGEFASKISVETIHQTFITSGESDVLKRIKLSIEKANKFVYEKSNGNLNFKGMAATCEVLLISDSTAFWGHIGDSRIYLYNHKKLTQLTKDHSVTQKLLDTGNLTAKEFKNHPRKSILTNAIGDEKVPEVDTSKLLLPSHSKMKFFICTDGVTAVVNDAELEKILLHKDLSKISSELSQIIEKRGAPDNYSFVIAAK